MRPSAPRTTEGRRGSDSRAFSRVEGSRETVEAVNVLPRRAVVGDSGDSACATTVVVSVACAILSVMRSASARGTRAVSKPSRDATTVSAAGAGSKENSPDPSAAVEELHRDADKRQLGLVFDCPAQTGRLGEKSVCPAGGALCLAAGALSGAAR